MYRFRKATNSDLIYLLNLNKETMKEYYELSFGAWNDDIQDSYFEEGFINEDYQIIMIGEEAVGCVSIRKSSKEIFIYDLLIGPKHQNRGIGTAILKDIIKEAFLLNVSVVLEVIKPNIRAQELYKKLNFKVERENNTHYIMRKYK